ncbi:MAG: lycopene beta-cyclase CrtY [Kofleriaceae bacterium]|nr:lycopene beta-cyclase CrtY [Kofleriaceae bacterium]MBP9169279.1 lycopene beta-cyclase CrtY [Kofleriaceae bacterium]MBP9859012.1 lycopene beta-cyclase CrtY [Kofleriaceae bacterium]
MTYDLVIVGGGLQAALIAVAVHARAPGRRIAILERGERLGGNHTWCFHATDVSPRMAEHLGPLIGHRWGGYDVAFPRYRRTLASGYAAIPSDRVDPVVRGLGPTVEVIDRATASAVGPGRVELTDGREFTAPWVIDARGPDHHVGVGGYQKFVGVELVLDRPHGVTRPLLMDARVAQIDGYRFLYVLPLAPDRLLVEDTYFSAGAYLDVATVAARARAYAEENGWRGQLVRTESGVLPLAWQADVVEPVPGLLVAGYAGGWFHPVTGYSLPMAARLAEAIADGLATDDLPGAVAAAVAAQRAQLGFATRLVWMMFRWFPAGERRGVLEHFYRLPPDTIGRFYALTMTRADRARVFLRRPPRGLSWRAVLSGGATLEAR